MNTSTIMRLLEAEGVPTLRHPPRFDPRAIDITATFADEDESPEDEGEDEGIEEMVELLDRNPNAREELEDDLAAAESFVRWAHEVLDTADR